MRSGAWFTVVALATALFVAAAGGPLAGSEGRGALWMGAAAGAALQLLLFWLLFVVAFPRQRLLAHGLGMLARFGLVALMALVVVPWLDAPPAPMLLSLVTVLFLTTLVEPAILQIASKTRR